MIADLDFLMDDTIGIIGCGHMGRALAGELLARGFPQERLEVSCGKSASSLESIKRAGLWNCLAENEEICRDSSIIFISVRPQVLRELEGLSFPEDSLVASCMAGISLHALKRILGTNAVRMMPSGPATIQEKRGIAAVYPHNYALTRILTGLDLQVCELSSEDLMHIFTVGVCLPAALLACGNGDVEAAALSLVEEYADFPEILAWAKDVLPTFERDEDREDYIRKTATRGGITEAIIGSLSAGSGLEQALRRGIARSREISCRFDDCISS
jgi:pyrroline-5-carboxylate reductase